MELDLKYRGRVATDKEVSYVNNYISAHTGYSRTKISQELCKHWNWRYSNGSLQEQLCRSYLLELERAGYIKLPPRKQTPNNPLANRKKPKKIEINVIPISTTLSSLETISIKQVRRTNQEQLYNSLIEQYHYLGYAQHIGENLKYMIYSGACPISCIGFSSAPRHIGSRDKYIGWDQYTRKVNIHLMAYNTRFLILPFVQVKNLASHILSQVSKRIASDWQILYGHPVYLLETFVDTDRFSGICYKAANWVMVGKTTGRGKNDHTNKPNRSIKTVWCYPLVKNFRELLTKTDI